MESIFGAVVVFGNGGCLFFFSLFRSQSFQLGKERVGIYLFVLLCSIIYITRIICVTARPSPLPPEGESARRSIPASISFVPATAGLMIAGEIVRDITGVK